MRYSVEFERNGQTCNNDYNRLDLAIRFAQAIVGNATNLRARVLDNHNGDIVRTFDLSTDCPTLAEIVLTVAN